MVAASLSTCALLLVSILCANNHLFALYEAIPDIAKELAAMAQAALPPGGLLLGEFRKDTPPGWCPGDPTYSLKLYMEWIRMWYRTFYLTRRDGWSLKASLRCSLGIASKAPVMSRNN